MSILKIESLCKYYGNKKNETKALDGISLEVQTCLLYTSDAADEL